MNDELQVVVLKGENVTVVASPVEIRVLRVAEPLHVLAESDRISVVTVGAVGPPGAQGQPGGGGGAAGRVFFLDPTVASDIAGYTLATEVPPATSPHTHLVQTVTGTGDVLVEEFATIPGVPGAILLPAGIALRVYHANTGASNQVARIKTELYRCEADGTIETLLRQDYTESFFGSDVQEITHVFVFTSSVVLTATQRLVWKVYVARVSGPNSFDVTLHFNGETEVSFIRSTLPTGGGGGSGDITQVGEVTSGAAFDGTQGTSLTFVAAGGDLSVAGSVSGAGGILYIDAGQGDIVGGGDGGALIITSGAGGNPTGDGGIIQITGGSASVGAGGYVQISGGDALSGNQLGGDVYISGGLSQGTAAGSIIALSAGGAPTSGVGGSIELFAGFSNQNTGGAINLTAGQTSSITGARGGAITLTSGFSGSSAGGASGDITIQTGGTNDADTGAVIIKSANATGTNRSTGDITLTTGTPTGSGTRGSIILDGGGASVKLPGGMLTTANTTNLSLATSSGTQLEVVHIVNPTCWVQTQSGGSGSLIGAKVTGAGSGNGNFFVSSAGTGFIGFTTRGGGWQQFEITHTDTTARWIRVTGATATGDPVLGVNNGPNIAISNVNLIWSPDNLTDIGASAATRPRSGYFGTSLTSPTIYGGAVAGDGLLIQLNTTGTTKGTLTLKSHPTYTTATFDSAINFYEDLTVNTRTGTANGTTIQVNNNSSDAAYLRLRQESSGDMLVQFYNVSPGGVVWSMGLDNSDSDKFVLSLSSIGLGTNNRLTITTDAASVDFSSTGCSLAGGLTFTPDNTLDIGASGATRPRTGYFGTSLTVPLITGGIAEAGSLTLKANTFASGGGSVFVYTRNDYLLLTLSGGGATLTTHLTLNQNTGTANTIAFQVYNTANQDATIRVRTGGSADPIYQAWDETSGQIWAWGVDQSNSDAFVLSSNSTLGTNDRIILTVAGAISLLGGSPGTTSTGGAITITSGPGGSVSGASGVVTITSGTTTDGNSGSISISAGDAAGTNRFGGNVSIGGGKSTGTRAGGAATLNGGFGGATGLGGAVSIQSGPGGSTSGASGIVSISTNSTTDGNTGAITLNSGAPSGTGRDSGIVTIKTGAGGADTGGSGAVNIESGSVTNGSSGAISISVGPATGSGTVGTIIFNTAGSKQVEITNTASATRFISLTGSAGGNPTISTSAGSLAITPAVVLASTLTFSTAASKIIPGATSLALRNNADGANNILIVDAGDVTIRGTLAWGSGTASKGVVEAAKTSNETVTSSTTLQSDDDLIVPVGASQTWFISYDLAWSPSLVDTGFKLGFSVPSGTTFIVHTTFIGDSSSTAVANVGGTSSPFFTYTAGGASSTGICRVFVVVTTSTTTGDFILQWAQETSHANALQLRAGSSLKAFRGF